MKKKEAWRKKRLADIQQLQDMEERKSNMIALTPITNSEAFREAVFDEATKSIVITFHNGERYRYTLDRLFRKWIIAPSAGQFFHQFIRPMPAEKLKEAD